MSNDTIYRQMAINAIEEIDCSDGVGLSALKCDVVDDAVATIKALPSAQQWTPIKWHYCTDEDRKEYGFNEDIVVVFDCDMPDNHQGILVTTSYGFVEKDICYIEDGFSLDSGYDWIEDIIAWAPLPEPYHPGEESKVCM